GYVATLGENLGVAPWPAVSTDSAGNVPAPYVVATFLSIPGKITGDKLQTATAFAKFWATDETTSLAWTVPNRRLPALAAAFNSDSIAGDSILSQSSKVLMTGVALPVQPQMQCVAESVTNVLGLLMNDGATATETAESAQKGALDCIAKMK